MEGKDEEKVERRDMWRIKKVVIINGSKGEEEGKGRQEGGGKRENVGERKEEM